MIATAVVVCGRRYDGVAMETFIDRLLGIHRAPRSADVVVLPGSSVHTLTLNRPLAYVAIGPEASLAIGGVLRPRRHVRILGATAIAEFPHRLFCQADHDVHRVRWLR